MEIRPKLVALVVMTCIRITKKALINLFFLCLKEPRRDPPQVQVARRARVPIKCSWLLRLARCRCSRP